MWLIFRTLVDLILINDFATYCIFFVAYWEWPQEIGVFDLIRWIGGVLIIGFNLWVKMDAHRVVKDFAWCMFFLIHTLLIFRIFYGTKNSIIR